MEFLYLWPDRPVLSLFVVWVVSAVFLWAGREPMLQMLRALVESLQQGFEGVARWCQTLASSLRERSRESLLAAGTLELQGKLDHELHRIDEGFSDKLEKYAALHRRLDELLLKADSDYRSCGDAPPEVPGWTNAVETIANIPTTGDPNVQKVLEGIRKSLHDSERKALESYRSESTRRHKILGGMSGCWREMRSLMTKMKDIVSQALETATRVNGFAEQYESLRSDREAAARALSYSAVKLFVISLLVLGIAFGGAFINFQLIALPMSELVPAGARVGGFPVSTVSALVIVLMEAAVGFFIMDLLGITDLFPKLASIPARRRRMILTLALCGLLFLASVEASLAILREKIVEADAALKMALAGSETAAVNEASSSNIPMMGQAVLGFVLPWILAMVAVPLEMLLDSGRHVVATLVAAVCGGFGNLCQVLGQLIHSLGRMIPSLYDVYISIPLRIERLVRRGADTSPLAMRPRVVDGVEAGASSGGGS
jgi:hypothetical protein